MRGPSLWRTNEALAGAAGQDDDAGPRAAVAEHLGHALLLKRPQNHTLRHHQPFCASIGSMQDMHGRGHVGCPTWYKNCRLS